MADNDAGQGRRSAATTRSTGGAGYAFEDLVGADLLSRILVDLPIHGIGVPGQQLISQAAALGWRVDDIICIGTDAMGADRKLLLSCKSNVQVTATGLPADFMAAAWDAWLSKESFDQTRDHIGLVTRGRNAAFDAIWSDLKTWCVGGDPSLAVARVNASARHRRVFDSVRAQGALGLATDTATLRLIAALDIYPLDFQLAASDSLSEAQRRCRSALSSEDNAEAAELWGALVEAARTARLGNGTVWLDDLLRGLAPRFALRAHPSISAAWQRLLSISADERAAIEIALPNGHVVGRGREGARRADSIANARHCVVAGDSGAGKSAFVRMTLDASHPDATQLWLGPEALSDAITEARRQSLGLDHPLAFILERSPGSDKILVLDSLERLDAPAWTRLNGLLELIAADPTWRVVLVSQFDALDDPVHRIAATAAWPTIVVPAPSNTAIRAALESVPALSWIAQDAALLPLFANLRMLGWVVAAESSFAQAEGDGLTSAAAIADRLWDRWTSGPSRTQLQRLLIRLAIREAAYERTFKISELDSGDAAAFDLRSPVAPLSINKRNSIEFSHDLASDWARYQRLKEIADDPPQWSALAREPLWINALRLFGQFLLVEPDQARHGWDAAFAAATTAGNTEARDVLLDALCLDPRLDQHLEARADLMFADEGALLQRLLHRFLQLATVPSIPSHIEVEEGIRHYLEAEMRFPIMMRWAPLGRYLRQNVDRVGALGAPVVARICRSWLDSLPLTLGDEPMPLRDVMADLALATAQTRQIRSAIDNLYGGGDDVQLIYSVALGGVADRPAEVAAFALEMAQRRPVTSAVAERIEALRATRRAEAATRASVPRQRSRALPAALLPSIKPLPPWRLGPLARVAGGFRKAVLHGNALNRMFQVDPDTASEVLLACLIEDNPNRDYGRSMRMEGDLGLEFDQDGYPTAFWKSPFFAFLGSNPDAAIAALKQLVDFVMERWSADIPADRRAPFLAIRLADGTDRQFPGTVLEFDWSQRTSTANGNLFCALDALERWLTLKAAAGEDMESWCARLLAFEGSTAILGILVNLGKFQPVLFKGPLRPLVGSEALYLWDSYRLQNGNLGFDLFSWRRQGQAVFDMARDWTYAPHRQLSMKDVVATLAIDDATFAADVMARAASWPEPDDAKQALEQRVLKSAFDPANHHREPDNEDGEPVWRLVYPADLQADIHAYETLSLVALQPVTLPHQCDKVLAGEADLADESAQYLADQLPKDEAAIALGDKLPMIAAAAATLIARGGGWLEQNADCKARAEQIIRAVIHLVDGIPDRDDHDAEEALRFAAIGTLYAALAADDAEAWRALLVASLTSSRGRAVSAVMEVAARHRAQLGSAWYRLNLLLLFQSGLMHLKPRFEDDGPADVWLAWRARLRRLPIFGVGGSINDIDPAGLGRRVERLLERRQAALYPERPARLTGKSRRFAGLNAYFLEAGYTWLLDHERAETNAAVVENHTLLRRLWSFEVWRMEGETEENNALDEGADDEYDLPSELGYAILRIAATFVLAAPADDPDPLWRAILRIGPRGYHAVEQFAAGWFLRLFVPVDNDRFMLLWRAILAFAFDAGWTTHRRWYRGRDMLTKILGINAQIELSQAPAIASRLPEVTDYYRRWAQDEMREDDDAIATFCHFLTTDAGRSLRLEGMVWVAAALTTSDRFARGETGNNISEAVDTVLTHHGNELLVQPEARDAVIAIVAKLARAQVPTAMGLQRRIAALR